MLRQLLLLIILFLSFQAPQALGQAKCKEYSPKGPGRGGPGRGGQRPGMPVIKVKPQPQYTKAALRHQVQGTVILRVILHSSGQVRDVCVVKGLPYGLTRRAVEAAYRIEFEPAVAQGRPVSKTILINYDFSTY
jgi:TonB family protein